MPSDSYIKSLIDEAIKQERQRIANLMRGVYAVEHVPYMSDSVAVGESIERTLAKLADKIESDAV